MSDNHNRKDSIEQLFREKAEDYQIDYNEEDWLKLQKRLDLQQKEKAVLRRRRWLVAASVIIISLLGYFTYQNYVNINEINRQLSDENVPQAQQPVQQDDQSRANAGDNLTDSEGDVDAEPNRAQEQKNRDPSSPSNPPDQLVDTPPVPPKDETSGNGQGGRESNEFAAAGQTGTDLSISEFNCSTCALAPAQGENLSAKVTDEHVTVPVQETENTLFAANSESGERFDNGIRQTSSRVSLGLVVSPDLSTVGSVSNFYEPGYKFGAIIEYRLSRNLQVSAGIVQSEVRYKAQGGQYRPPSGYWTYGVVPEETTGECLLIDIPINIKYNFLHFDRSRIYATTGISSYIMLDETYQFNYEGDGSELVQGWSGQTGTRHWLSNLGFSVGYEFDLHPNWSLRAEPFIKVPLKEVGWGNVKLYSVGSFISINYNLN